MVANWSRYFRSKPDVVKERERIQMKFSFCCNGVLPLPSSTVSQCQKIITQIWQLNWMQSWWDAFNPFTKRRPSRSNVPRNSRMRSGARCLYPSSKDEFRISTAVKISGVKRTKAGEVRHGWHHKMKRSYPTCWIQYGSRLVDPIF